jgi:hypothetical protein
MGYASPRSITSQADDNLVPICDRARNDLYGSKRSVVFHAWSGSTTAERWYSGSPQPLSAGNGPDVLARTLCITQSCLGFRFP